MTVAEVVKREGAKKGLSIKYAFFSIFYLSFSFVFCFNLILFIPLPFLFFLSTLFPFFLPSTSQKSTISALPLTPDTSDRQNEILRLAFVVMLLLLLLLLLLQDLISDWIVSDFISFTYFFYLLYFSPPTEKLRSSLFLKLKLCWRLKFKQQRQ